MAQISTEQALQIPQKLQNQGSNNGTSTDSRQKEQADKRVLLDDAVTLLRLGVQSQAKKVNVDSFKGELGRDQSYLKETKPQYTAKHTKRSFRTNRNKRIITPCRSRKIDSRPK